MNPYLKASVNQSLNPAAMRRVMQGSSLMSLRRTTVQGEKLSERACSALAGLYRRCFEGPPWNERWTRDAAREEIDRYIAAGATFAVCRSGGALAGFAIGLPLSRYDDREVLSQSLKAEPSWYVAELGVAQAFRGRGIAKLVVGDLVAAGVDAGALGVSARTRTDNTPALRVFEGLGFKRVGILRAETGGVVSERIVFELPLKRLPQ